MAETERAVFSGFLNEHLAPSLNEFRENNGINYKNDGARASLPASWRITTYFRRIVATASDNEDAIPNGHVLF